MTEKTSASLRAQIIESMKKYCDTYKFYTLNEQMMFDDAIMPVLQKAMDAGMLLVGRNTKERIPVNQAVMKWLEEVSGHVMLIAKEEAVISRRQLLKIIYQFGDQAEIALSEARKIGNETH